METLQTITDDLLQEGVLAARAGQRAQATDAFVRAIHEDPREDIVWLCLASVTESLQMRLYYLDRVIELNPCDERAVRLRTITRMQFSDELVTRASIATRSGDTWGANHCLLHAVELNPRNETAWLALAQLDEPPAAPQMLLERVLEINPDNGHAKVLLDGNRIKELEPTPPAAAPRAIPEPLEASAPVEMQTVDTLERVETPPQPDPPLLLHCETPEVEQTAAAPEQPVMPLEPVMPPEPVMILETVMPPEPEPAKAEPAKAVQVEPKIEAKIEAKVEPQPTPVPEPKAEAPLLPLTHLTQCPLCDAILFGNKEKCRECYGLLSPKIFLVEGSGSAGAESTRRQTLLAAARYNRILARDPNDAVTHYKLGLAYLNLRHPDAALRSLQRASELRPDADLGAILQWLRDAKTQRTPKPPVPVVENREFEIAPEHTILVIDDSPTVRKSVAQTLEKYGYRIVSAVDGHDGLVKLGQCKPSLVFLDIMMPKLDGYQVCKAIRETSKNLPVVMLSGKDGFFDKVRGKVAGSTAYITKPFEPRTLVDTARKHCKSRSVHKEK